MYIHFNVEVFNVLVEASVDRGLKAAFTAVRVANPIH
jgi:hypothetical protein